ncbi:MAG: hypothetical protein ACMXYL_01525 [Candidatus Woesearchaeota archaeon]
MSKNDVIGILSIVLGILLAPIGIIVSIVGIIINNRTNKSITLPIIGLVISIIMTAIIASLLIGFYSYDNNYSYQGPIQDVCSMGLLQCNAALDYNTGDIRVFVMNPTRSWMRIEGISIDVGHCENIILSGDPIHSNGQDIILLQGCEKNGGSYTLIGNAVIETQANTPEPEYVDTQFALRIIFPQ